MKKIVVATAAFAAALAFVISPAMSDTSPIAAPAQASAPVTSTTATSASGKLSLTVNIIDDLTPKPVPLTEFALTGAAVQTLRTDASGLIQADLPPGHYHIASVKPTTFKDHGYSWAADFDIKAGETTPITPSRLPWH